MRRITVEEAVCGGSAVSVVFVGQWRTEEKKRRRRREKKKREEKKRIYISDISESKARS